MLLPVSQDKNTLLFAKPLKMVNKVIGDSYAGTNINSIDINIEKQSLLVTEEIGATFFGRLDMDENLLSRLIVT